VLVGRDVAKIAVFLDKHHVIGVDLPLLRRQPFKTPLGPLAILVFALFRGTILQILPGLCEFFSAWFLSSQWSAAPPPSQNRQSHSNHRVAALIKRSINAYSLWSILESY